MKLLARIFLMLAFVAAMPLVLRAEDNATKLLGMWREFSPGDNLVEFKPGTVSMLLRKGEIQDLHTMDGTWTLSPDGTTLTLTFKVGGQDRTLSATLAFTGDEMVLTDDTRIPTRHRRHTGPLPDWAKW